MPVLISFAGEKVNCRHLEIATGNVRVGDILVVSGRKVRVETVQKNCPYIENLHRVFTAYVMRDEKNELVTSRGFGCTKIDVWRSK
jgi:hypothetical protein